jgi:hypothetical protein
VARRLRLGASHCNGGRALRIMRGRGLTPMPYKFQSRRDRHRGGAYEVVKQLPGRDGALFFFAAFMRLLDGPVIGDGSTHAPPHS